MRKVMKMLPVFLLPLILGWGAVRAADKAEQSVGGLKITLADGTLVNGASSVVIDLDTPYGKIKVPSSSLVSAKFDPQNSMADIQLNDAQLKIKYKPASSDVKATTAAGPLTIAMEKVTSIANASVQVAKATPPQAPASQYTPPANPSPQTTAPASPPSTYPVQPQQPPVSAPPTVTYPYPYSYPYPYYEASPEPYAYAAPAPYPYYYGGPYYAYSPYYYGWPYWGFGVTIGPFGHFGHSDHFDHFGGFHGGFHGGFGGHAGHR